MKITIVGGGNIGTQFAVHCAEKKHDVTVYTSAPDLFSDMLSTVDELGNVTHEGRIACATKDPEKAFAEADYIIITLPSTMMDSIAETIYQYSSKEAVIGVVPGNGGSECAFKRCIERGNAFFEIERVPAIARLVQKGKTVRSTGYRNELHIVATPSENTGEICDVISSIFEIPCRPISNYLNLTLTPSNPIVHTTRLYTLFRDYKEGVTYESVPLFYEGWDDASSEMLLSCDEEVQKICKALPEIDLSSVKSLKDYYESYTVSDMTKKISGIPAFKGLSTPAVKVDGGYIPDLHSRFFTADFSYGLTLIKHVADFAGVSVPNIDKVMQWYENIAIEKKAFAYSNYGINSKQDLIDFYNR